MTNDQKEIFRFTRVWRDLITLLHEQVVLKRRKYLIRSSIGPVFSGSNAVDVLHRHLQLHPGIFPNLEMMGRSNCVRLCQRFLDLRVFFPSKDKSSALKILFEDSNFVFYRFNYNNDFIGAPMVNRSLKRSNSETDLLSALPAKQQKPTPPAATLSKQISNLSTFSNRIRKSIRRRSSQKPDQNLTTIVERGAHFDASMCEASICESSFESNALLVDKSSTPRQPRKSVTRSNAFRKNVERFSQKSKGDGDTFSIRSLSLNKISSTSIHSVKSASLKPSSNSSKFQISTPIIESRRRSLQQRLCNRKSALDTRKKVKSIANFNLSLSIAL